MKKLRCKKCGDTSYDDLYFCLNCDDGFWKYSWRRYSIQTWVPGVLLCILGVLLNILTDISGFIHWTIWGIGIALIIAACLSTPRKFGWGIKLVKRQFEELDEEVMPSETILEGCEVGCITLESGLVGCPLSKEEWETCKRRKEWIRLQLQYRTYGHELSDEDLARLVKQNLRGKDD